MALNLDLNKAAATLKLSLEKAGINTPPEAEMGFDLDVSGSFKRQHLSGQTNIVMTRLVPWAMVFDPDKKLDVFTFSDGPDHAHYVGEVTTSNYQDFVSKSIIERVPGWGRGTDYAYVLQKNLVHFGWRPGEVQAQKSGGGMFGGLFGKKKAEPAATPTQRRKSLIMFITDGENDDASATENLLADMERRGDQVYIQFFGLNSDSSVKFRFLQKVADRFSNTGLHICRDIDEFGRMSDEEINDLIIQDELIAWLKK